MPEVGFVEDPAGWAVVERQALTDAGDKALRAAERYVPHGATGQLAASLHTELAEDEAGTFLKLEASRLNQAGVQVVWYVEAHESFLRAAVGSVAGGRSAGTRAVKRARRATLAARRTRRQAKRAAMSGEIDLKTVAGGA